jgi:glycosyltransferase involved in cell wall biosynthesis
MQTPRLKVLHFVAGGFTGSTSVAIDLVKSTHSHPHITSQLVLRKRPTTDINQVQKLIDAQVLVTLSRENYSKWRLLQAHWPTKYTSTIVACAQSVKVQLEKLKLPSQKIMVIPNGIALERFEAADTKPFAQRIPDIVMPARFGKQKGHITVIKALAILRDKGLQVPTVFAGLGHPRYLKNAKELTISLQLGTQITFTGHINNLPELLINHQICLLSSHYKGMPIRIGRRMCGHRLISSWHSRDASTEQRWGTGNPLLA